jgi:TRAP-type uncharacterized transport system substrate-binding protein
MTQPGSDGPGARGAPAEAAPAERAPLTFVQKVARGEFLLLTSTEQLRLALIALVTLATVLWLLFNVVEPPPPKVIRIWTGAATGAYSRYAKQYVDEFKKHGITLEVLTSAGSLENLKRLDDAKQKVDLAFVQGGVSSSELHPGVEGLASVAYEPIWFFYNKKRFSQQAPPKRLPDLAGHSLAIDAEGSGVRAAATQLLTMNQMATQGDLLVPLGGMGAVDALLNGTLDAAMIVAAVDSPAVQRALSEDLGLMHIENADAYVRLLPWLAKATLPKGVANIARDIPHEDVVLIAATANLVARGDLHPAIMFLMLDIASTVHKRPAAINAPTEFPSEHNLDYTQSEESKRFFKSGRPFLQQYLPFWLANLVGRLFATLVPMLAIGLPLIRLIPAFLGWRERAQLTQLYDEVLALENKHYVGAEERAGALTRLAQIDRLLPSLKLGADHHVDVYNLKAHIDFVVARLRVG